MAANVDLGNALPSVPASQSGFVVGNLNSQGGPAQFVSMDQLAAAVLNQKGRMYQIGFSWPGGVPKNSQRIGDHCFSIGVSFPPNFSIYNGHKSQGVASAASTGTATFNVQKNGSNSGTIVFTSATTATFTTSGGTVLKFAQGDILTIIAPGTADATLANPAFTLVGYET